MTQHHLPSRGRHSQEGYICASLSRPNDQYARVSPKLSPGLELRGVKHARHVLYPWDQGNVGLDV